MKDNINVNEDITFTNDETHINNQHSENFKEINEIQTQEKDFQETKTNEQNSHKNSEILKNQDNLEQIEDYNFEIKSTKNEINNKKSEILIQEKNFSEYQDENTNYDKESVDEKDLCKSNNIQIKELEEIVYSQPQKKSSLESNLNKLKDNEVEYCKKIEAHSDTKNKKMNSEISVQDLLESDFYEKYFVNIKDGQREYREKVIPKDIYKMIIYELYRSNGIDKEFPIDLCIDTQEDIDNILPFLRKTIKRKPRY